MYLLEQCVSFGKVFDEKHRLGEVICQEDRLLSNSKSSFSKHRGS